MLGKATIAVALLAIACAAAGVLLAHFEIIQPNAGLALFALGGLFGFLSTLLAVAVLFISQRYGAAMIGVLGALPLVAVLAAALAALQVPPINDISTDLANPPDFVHARTLPENAGRDMIFPPENGPLIQQAYPELKPLALTADPDIAYHRALEAARATKDWIITREDPAARTFEGIAITKTFRWRDDFIVRVTPAPNGGSIIDMRSKSRQGKSDIGANARRIALYFQNLRKTE